MNTTIICPNCKKPFEISDAIQHQIEDELLRAKTEQSETLHSCVKTHIAPSCPKHAKKARELYSENIQADGRLTMDILLRSPAEAACFVTGTSINAREAWKTIDGRTLNDIESSEGNES